MAKENNKKAPSAKKGIIKILLGLLGILVLLTVSAGAWAYLRIGSPPSDQEKTFYSTLPNYRTGKFLNLEPVEINTKKLAKKAGFFRFIFSSPNVPGRPYPRVELIKSSFPAKPEEFNVCWLGHSSLIFELGGVRFMVDPVFGNAAPLPGIVNRFVPSPLPRH